MAQLYLSKFAHVGLLLWRGFIASHHTSGRSCDSIPTLGFQPVLCKYACRFHDHDLFGCPKAPVICLALALLENFGLSMLSLANNCTSALGCCWLALLRIEKILVRRHYLISETEGGRQTHRGRAAEACGQDWLKNVCMCMCVHK